MPLDLDATRSLLASLLPVRTDRWEVALARGDDAVALGSTGYLRATLVIRVFEDTPERAVRDVKEQHVVLVPGERHDDPRVGAYLRAWARALPAIAARFGGEVDVLMPSDFAYPEALDVREATTEADFYAALTARDDLFAAWAEARAAEDFLAELAWCGVAEYADGLRPLRQPSLRMRTEPLDADDALPLGATRMGGLPDLPAGCAWPSFRGEPFGFVAQVDLDEVARRGLDATGLLPREGVLAFFAFGAAGPEDPSDPEWRGGGRVLYFDAAARASLARASAPAGLDPWMVHAPRAVEFEVERLVPAPESPFYPALLGASGYVEALDRAIRVFGDYASRLGPPALGGEDEDRPRHKLLGYADPLQSSPYVACERESRGGVDGDGDYDAAFWRSAARWQLLLQADSDLEADVLFGDNGLVYFMIRPEDLAARRFDRAWTTMQCY